MFFCGSPCACTWSPPGDTGPDHGKDPSFPPSLSSEPAVLVEKLGRQGLDRVLACQKQFSRQVLGATGPQSVLR